MLTECKYSAIIQEKNYSQKIDGLSEDYPRIYDVQENIDWTLGKNALIGMACEDDPKHRIIKTTPIGVTPSFWVLYRFEPTEQKVYLLSITPAPPEE